MVGPDTGAWLAAGALLLAGGWVVAMNLRIVALALGKGEHHSFTPLAGGALCAAALRVCPAPGAGAYAWVPLVVDPGCLFALLLFLYATVVLKAFRR